MNHMFCTLFPHNQSNFIGVCITKKCEISQRLLCGHCSLDRLHDGHLNDIMPLTDFCNLSDQGLKIMEERDLFFKELKESVKKIYKEFYQRMQVLEYRMMNIIDEQYLEIKRFQKLFENMQSQNKMSIDQNEFNELLQHFGTHFHVDELRNSDQQFQLTLSDESGIKCAQFGNLYREVKNIITGLVEQSQKIDKLIDNVKSEPIKPRILPIKKSTNVSQLQIIQADLTNKIGQTQNINQQKKQIKVIQLQPQTPQQHNS